jgi:hypothetical protein
MSINLSTDDLIPFFQKNSDSTLKNVDAFLDLSLVFDEAINNNDIFQSASGDLTDVSRILYVRANDKVDEVNFGVDNFSDTNINILLHSFQTAVDAVSRESGITFDSKYKKWKMFIFSKIIKAIQQTVAIEISRKIKYEIFTRFMEKISSLSSLSDDDKLSLEMRCQHILTKYCDPRECYIFINIETSVDVSPDKIITLSNGDFVEQPSNYPKVKINWHIESGDEGNTFMVSLDLSDLSTRVVITPSIDSIVSDILKQKGLMLELIEIQKTVSKESEAAQAAQAAKAAQVAKAAQASEAAAAAATMREREQAANAARQREKEAERAAAQAKTDKWLTARNETPLLFRQGGVGNKRKKIIGLRSKKSHRRMNRKTKSRGNKNKSRKKYFIM